MATYRADLRERQAQLAAAAAALMTALERLQDTTLCVQQNVTRLMELSDATVSSMHRVVWEAGSCDLVHENYEHVRAPLCEGVVDSVLAVWVLAILAVALWLALLLSVSRLVRKVGLRGWGWGRGVGAWGRRVAVLVASSCCCCLCSCQLRVWGLGFGVLGLEFGV
jgi:hypothetical protein